MLQSRMLQSDRGKGACCHGHTEQRVTNINETDSMWSVSLKAELGLNRQMAIRLSGTEERRSCTSWTKQADDRVILRA